MTHDYKRDSTVDLFAALNVGTGEVLHLTRKRHTANDVLAFFGWIDLRVPKQLDVHVVLDNLSAHSAPPVAEWLEHHERARWHLHFTPTSSSWLNLVEGWFAQLTNRRLRHGSFDWVAARTRSTCGHHTGTTTRPFVWHKAAKAIITKVRQGPNPRHTARGAGRYVSTNDSYQRGRAFTMCNRHKTSHLGGVHECEVGHQHSQLRAHAVPVHVSVLTGPRLAVSVICELGSPSRSSLVRIGGLI